jgi:hypothetical protein
MSTPGSDTPASSPATKQSRKRSVATSEWKVVKIKIENGLRPTVLRYGKPTDEQVEEVVQKAVGPDVCEEDYSFRKGLQKARSNIATWKNKSLGCMEVSRDFSWSLN